MGKVFEFTAPGGFVVIGDADTRISYVEMYGNSVLIMRSMVRTDEHRPVIPGQSPTAGVCPNSAKEQKVARARF